MRPVLPPAIALAMLVGGVAACLDDSITGVRELSMALASGQTLVSAGDSVVFEYVAEGTGLVVLYFEYGDGVTDTLTVSGGFEEPGEEYWNADTLFLPGPLGVSGTMTHAFDVAGTFFVIGRAIGAGGVASDTVSVTVE